MLAANTRRGEAGSTLVTVTAMVTVLLAIGATVSTLGFASARSTSRSHGWMQSFYLADSGAQIGNARLRAAGWDLPATAFHEEIDGHPVDVTIVPQTAGVYEITSTSAVRDERSTVEMIVEFIPSSLLDGGVQVNVSNGVEVESDTIPVWLSGTVDVSGYDHDLAGVPTGGAAVRGIAVNPVPGETGVTVEIEVSSTPNVTLEGEPAAVGSDASNLTEFLDRLGSEARTAADVNIWGSTSLDDAMTGVFGTEASPKLVHVDLGDNGNLKLKGSFQGYGTLFIEAGRINDVTALTLDGTAGWTGLVVLHVRDEVNLSRRELIEIVGTNGITGGLVVSLAGPSVDFGRSGKLLRVVGTAIVLYSSRAVASAPGWKTSSGGAPS